MKKKELQALREKDIKELGERVIELKKKITEFTPNLHAGKEKNLKTKKNAKRDIAQILGIIHEKRNI